MKICPKCGGREFITTAHVIEEWIVDSDGNYLDTYCTGDVTHTPDDDNIWQCNNCGYDAAGTEFNVYEEE